jgi:hypothetical protein
LHIFIFIFDKIGNKRSEAMLILVETWSLNRNGTQSKLLCSSLEYSARSQRVFENTRPAAAWKHFYFRTLKRGQESKQPRKGRLLLLCSFSAFVINTIKIKIFNRYSYRLNSMDMLKPKNLLVFEDLFCMAWKFFYVKYFTWNRILHIFFAMLFLSKMFCCHFGHPGKVWRPIFVRGFRTRFRRISQLFISLCVVLFKFIRKKNIKRCFIRVQALALLRVVCIYIKGKVFYLGSAFKDFCLVASFLSCYFAIHNVPSEFCVQ